MPTVPTLKKKLTNFAIIEKSDRNFNPYFIIFDNDNKDGNNAYFVWNEADKATLNNNKRDWKEIEVEYIEGNEPGKGNRVVNLFVEEEFLA